MTETWVQGTAPCARRILRYLKCMTHFENNNGERFADFVLPDGCMLCGGSVSVRATASGAHSYCPQCHWLSRPQMRMRGNGVELSFTTAALA